MAKKLRTEEIPEQQLPQPFIELPINSLSHPVSGVSWHNKQYRLDDVIQSLRDQSRINGGKIDIDIFMNWEMLAEMVSSGMDIGAHGISHRVLSSMSMEEQVQEVTGVKNIIEDRLKIDIKAFAYPEGGSGSYNQDSLEVLKDAGYKLTFNFVSGVNTDLKKNIYELNRFSVNKNLSVSDLKQLVSLDWFCFV